MLTFSSFPSPSTVSASQLPMDEKSAFSSFFQQSFLLDSLPPRSFRIILYGVPYSGSCPTSVSFKC
jgi:hypothetical protein